MVSIDHTENDCVRPGGPKTFYSHTQAEDYSHRLGLMTYFKVLVSTYIKEMDGYYTTLHHEITSQTEGRPEVRMMGLGREHIERLHDIEYYTLYLQRSNMDYHKRLIEYDDAFYNRAMVMTDEMKDMSREEIESIIDLRFYERKTKCEDMFREHLTEMKEIRETMRTSWNKIRRSMMCYIEENPILTPVGSRGSRVISLPYELEELWKK